MALTIEKEEQWTNKIHALEAAAWQAIKWIPEAEELLESCLDSKRSTRERELQALEACVEDLASQDLLSSDAKSSISEAKLALARARALRWDLVMEIEYMVRSESSRLAKLHFVAFEDLVQEGYLGALQAARRFECGRDVRFATYARWWIRAQITRCLEHQGRIVRLPGGAVELRRNIRHCIAERERHGVEVDLAEVAEEVGTSLKRLNELMVYQGTVSMEHETPSGRCVKDTLTDESLDRNPEAFAEFKSSINLSMQRLERLESRQREILYRHYGLHNHEPTSISQIGRDLGLSRERVRQLQKDALRRIERHYRVSKACTAQSA
jgi:RNA polymerase sigma factor (sigma-70 family)